MFYKSLSSVSNYPNEKLLISFNPTNPALLNTRVGSRFRYSYYGNNSQFNLTNSEYPLLTASIPDTVLNRAYVLSSYNNGVLLSAKSPTEYLNINDFSPFYWNVYNENENLYFNILAGLSGLTVFPSQPFPKITKISNHVVRLSCGVVAASGFDGDVNIYHFRNCVKNSNFNTISSISPITSSVQFHRVKKYESKKDYNLGTLINYNQHFYANGIGSNIYNKSFNITVPVATSTKDTDPVYFLNFVTSDFDEKNNTKITNGYVTLSCLRSEALESMGITYPYTYDFPYNRLQPVQGEIYLHFKQLLVRKGFDVTCSFVTSSQDVNSNIVSCSIIDSNTVQISCNPSFGPIFNYNFTLYKPDNVNDALTMSFEPSSRIVSSVSSAVLIETKITDNYHQNYYDSFSGSDFYKRFVEIVGDGKLLSKDSFNYWYDSGEWMPLSSTMTMFNRDNNANKYSFRVEIGKPDSSSIIRNDENNTFQILLNKEKAVISPIITENASSSASVYAVSLPYSDALYGSKWDVFPPENVIITKTDGTVISANTFYDDLFEIKLYNLGVDKTKITFYSSEYETSASTYWFPPSSVAQDCFLELKGQSNDFDETGSITMSALWNRNGYSYRIPVDANIIWNETANDVRGKLTFKTSSSQNTILSEGSVYAGNYDYSTLNCSVSTQKATSDPKTIVFDVNCNVFGPNYNFITNNTFLYRQYPFNDFLSIIALTSVGANQINSDQRKHVILKNNATITLSAYYPYLIADSSNISWNILNSNGTTKSFTGETSSFLFNVLSSVVTINVLSAKPFSGNFGYYNFSDSIVFYKLPNITNFDYIGFPENQYNPVLKIASNVSDYGVCGTNWDDTSFTIYSQSKGMSSYKPCHTENFYFSATPGFDYYIWKTGDKITNSKSNKVVIPLSYGDVSGSGAVSVSAYNDVFINSDDVTQYNYASSDSSNIYKQPISFLDFPTPTANISLNRNVCDSSKYGELPKLVCQLNTFNTDITNYNFHIVLSGENFVQSIPYSNDVATFSKLLKIGVENSDFIINKNSFNHTKVYLSGDIGVTINGFDFCSQTKIISSNIVNLSVYNGPSLELYTDTNYVSTGQAVYFYNNSNQNFFTNPSIKYDYFLFDAGEGGVISTTTSSISTIYATTGSKTPSMTGFLSNSAVNITQWKDMIFVKNEKEQYDSNITREFYENVELPYSLQDCFIKPNDWQFSSNVNNSLEKLKTNLEFLSSCCYINNLNFPKAFGGFLATKFGNFQWHINETTTNLQNNYFDDLKSGQIINDKLLVVNSNRIELYSYSNQPALLFSTNTIGNAEMLENPVKCLYIDSRLYILDNGKQSIFICDFDLDLPQNIKLTHYWGGFGSRQDKTKLNNPVDFCLDQNKNLYIVDQDSYIIKVYNKNLNWIRNISLSYFSESNKPTSITCDGSDLFVCMQNGQSFIIDEFGIVKYSYSLKDTTKCFFNILNSGIIYIVQDKILKKYTQNSTFVNEHYFDETIKDIFFDDVHCYVLCSNYIYKIVDFIQIDSIINDDESLSGFSWSSILLNENEFVSDYIYNDSFKKIKDNISLLNSRIQNKLILEYGDGKTVSNQSTSAFMASSLSNADFYIGSNEPVLYDTINRGIKGLYNNLSELKNNINVGLDYPNINENIKWIWKYHYIDSIQKPSLLKSPVTWSELMTDQISLNTVLSSISSWCSIRQNLGGNHSDICFNYSQTRSGSYIPFKWSDMEQSSDACNFIRAYKWNELEADCCRTPDFVFEDCATIC